MINLVLLNENNEFFAGCIYNCAGEEEYSDFYEVFADKIVEYGWEYELSDSVAINIFKDVLYELTSLGDSFGLINNYNGIVDRASYNYTNYNYERAYCKDMVAGMTFSENINNLISNNCPKIKLFVVPE